MKKSFLILLAGSFVLFASCKKEGCTDSTATNYNEDAGKDDESCLYDGSLKVWLSQSFVDTTSASFPLDVWMGGGSVGALDSDHALTAAPTDCSDEDGVVYTKNFQFDKSTTSVTVYDANNVEVFRITGQEINKNECTKIII